MGVPISGPRISGPRSANWKSDAGLLHDTIQYHTIQYYTIHPTSGIDTATLILKISRAFQLSGWAARSWGTLDGFLFHTDNMSMPLSSRDQHQQCPCHCSSGPCQMTRPSQHTLSPLESLDFLLGTVRWKREMTISETESLVYLYGSGRGCGESRSSGT